MNYFVFVVCGAREYIEELNFSLKFLRRFSKYPIIVLSDNSRNEIPIAHDHIIDIETPKALSNHQAHLYIETGLPHYIDLNDEDICCYLDSDVIAINEKINDVFLGFIPPVRFAQDHCRIDQFSVGVMHCHCVKDFETRTLLFHQILESFPPIDPASALINGDRDILKRTFDTIKTKPFSNFSSLTTYLLNRYIWPSSVFQFKGFTFNKTDKIWRNAAGSIIDYDFPFHNKKVCKKFRLKYVNNEWVNEEGRVVKPELPYCHHLREYLNSEYAINIPENFQHWNGGVFLFKKSSVEFMDYWHNLTMAESSKGCIKSYDDQGTLIVSAFKFGVQDMPTLPVKYNFITDFNNESVKYREDSGYTFNDFKTAYSPAFLHVYNHWGDESWDIWQSVISLGKKLKIID